MLQSTGSHCRRRLLSRMGWCEHPSSLVLHPAETSHSTQHSRRLQQPQEFFLLAIAAIDIELQPNMLARAGAVHILHHPMMTLQDSADLVAYLFDTGPRDFITREQNFQVKRFLQMP